MNAHTRTSRGGSRGARIGGVALWLAACGGPVLQNAPRPNPAAVAGAAAATAAAITLADPDAAARTSEAATSQRELRPIEVHEQVPKATFDRLDAQHASEPAREPPPGEKSTAPVPVGAKRAPPIGHVVVPSPKQAAEQQR